MARRSFSNTAVSTTLSAGISSGDLSLTVVAATGYPAAPFVVVVDQGQVTEEVILVGAKAGTTFSSLTRGYDGSSAAAHSSGATCKHELIAADLEDANAHRWATPASSADTDSAQASIHHTIDTVAPTTSALADAASAGTALKASARDHKHGRESFATNALVLGTAAAAGAATTPLRSDDTIAAFDATVPGTSAPGDAAAAGSVAKAARRDHTHGRESFATPGIVLGSSAAAGAAGTLIRSDSTIAAFDATSPAASAPGDSAVVGTAAFAAHRDHKHAREAFAAPSLTLGTANSAGVAATLIRTDATILAFDATAPNVVQAGVYGSIVGTATTAARRDHQHGLDWGLAQTADVTTSQTTASATYTDLATSGPSVDVTIGTSGMALVIVSGHISNPSNTSFMSFAETAGTPVTAIDVNAIENATSTASTLSRMTLVTGLAGGVNTFTAKYKTTGGSTGTFSNRRIIVLPL